METLQRWIAQKGDGAANALSEVLTSLGYSPDAVIAAVQDEQKSTRLAELADRLVAEKIDEAELAAAVAAKKAEVVKEKP